MVSRFTRKSKRYGVGYRMKENNETTRKVKIEDLEFIDKLISDRHSIGTDKTRISQARAWNFITKYIKLDSVLYDKLKMIPIIGEQNV
jgi:hypothetical protein